MLPILLLLINKGARCVNKLPPAADGNRAGLTEHEVNAISSDTHLKQGVTDKAPNGKICWSPVNRDAS